MVKGWAGEVERRGGGAEVDWSVDGCVFLRAQCAMGDQVSEEL